MLHDRIAETLGIERLSESMPTFNLNDTRLMIEISNSTTETTTAGLRSAMKSKLLNNVLAIIKLPTGLPVYDRKSG
jgi:hypothetical protein